ncbi:hypothetical protein [Micromonospora yangpuensis]|uniref:Putative ABC transport system permease protein n=1 Tax=Micromonospora yangpuensis TaxID=683228 RepID=A0A1C6UDM6_9ACTN|nr:hypothetical protein [Micromonospora yangpuensis]GGM27228.1 hypothetical protein GCM10012279_52250 [Micromonospora yangpuensis]SCL52195.1 putative ABC transport system permease protein [Micromonospora yangpuensis]
MTGVVRRIRAHRGSFLLLAVLTLVVTAGVSGVPRFTARLSDEGLRQHLAAQPATQRDLSYTTVAAARPDAAYRSRQTELAARLDRMPPEVRHAVAHGWYLAETDPGRLAGPDLAARNLLVDLRLRAMPEVGRAAALVDGAWPPETPPAMPPETPPARRQPTPLALAVDVAERLNLRVGSRLTLAASSAERPLAGVELVVVGLFRPVDPADGTWDTLPPVLRVVQPEGEGKPFNVVGLVGAGGFDDRAAAGWPVRFSWRYRVAPDRIDVGDLDRTIDALAVLGRDAGTEAPLTQGLDLVLREFAAAAASARSLLAVVSAGMLATLAGLVVLTVGLAGRNRRAEFALIRARGGTRFAPARRCLAESALVVVPTAVLGGLLGSLVPTAPSGHHGGGSAGVALLLVAVAVTLALPLAALAVPAGTGGRRDLIRLSPSARRLTGEVLLLALALLGVLLLRRRGLAVGGVDPLLVSVPVLVAVAAAVWALRAYPWPLRLVSRLSAGTRGSVFFLGTARAGRAGVATPLVVVVVAVATAAFCAVVTAGIEAGRDRSTTRAVPADALVHGYRLAPETADELGRLAGVRAVTPVLAESGRTLARDAVGTTAGVGETAVLVVDGPGLVDAAARAGRAVPVPDALRTSGTATGAVPAVVSPAVAADLAGAGLDRSAFVEVQGERYEFRVADTVADFPLLRPGTERFVVLPWQTLPPRRYPPAPTGFLLAAEDPDVGALRRVGDAGQRRFQTSGTVTATTVPLPVTVSTWADLRAERAASGANGLLAFGFLGGAVGGTGLGLLAIVFTVLAGARDRGRLRSRLRTLGLSRRQWRGLLLVELVPLVGVAVLTGALVGALLPVLLTPVLGLSAFTDGGELS